VALVWISRVRLAGVAPRWLTLASGVVVTLPLLSGNLVVNAHWLVAFVVASMTLALTLAVAWRSLVGRREPGEPRAVTGAA
jgi:hypothetical protein